MNSDSVVSAYRAHAVQVVDMVFTTMLGLNAEPCTAAWTRPEDLVTAAVYFAGVWRGAVLLECTRQQACNFARLLMSIDLPETVNDDVRDALGELANMLAGNLKSVLPPGVVLSMPTVIEGSDYSLQICGRRLIERLPFRTHDDVFEVTLVELLDAVGREATAVQAATEHASGDALMDILDTHYTTLRCN